MKHIYIIILLLACWSTASAQAPGKGAPAPKNNQPVSWEQLNLLLGAKTDTVTTINGQPLSRNVSLSKTDIGLEKVDNTSDLNKPVSSAALIALAMKADKATTLAGYGITDAALNTSVVHKSGDETIEGVKIFNGKIGIGTTSQGNYRLSVKGAIRAQALKIEPGSWADYVLYDTYKLPALNEVESFIKSNRHLPDMPSEAEVKRAGIDVGEMNVLLLKKIEELTLYMIEKDKEVGELKSRVKKLESRKGNFINLINRINEKGSLINIFNCRIL